MLSLVNYSSSEDDDCSEPARIVTKDSLVEPPSKKIRLPNAIKHIHFGPVQSADEDVETGNSHGGRVRSFAHERGNWATYVYVNVPPNEPIQQLQDDMISFIATELSIDLQPTDHLHVSLTRTVVLKHHWIESFVDSLKESLPKTKKFPIHLDTINVYCNDERTRTFVALSVAPEDCAPTKRIVDALDRCLDEFKLPPFYKDASFHMSVLWCVGDHKDALLGRRSQLLDMLHEHIARSEANNEDEAFGVVVDHVECKIGNKFYAFPLS